MGIVQIQCPFLPLLPMTNEEIEKLKADNEKLKAQLEIIKQELAEAKTQLRRAKNPNPFIKPSFKLVARLVWDCCMNIKKTAGGWLLTMGSSLQRKFKSLKQIWELLTQDDWVLSDIFTTPKPKKNAKPRLPKRYGGLLDTIVGNTPFKYNPSTGHLTPEVSHRNDFAYANSS